MSVTATSGLCARTLRSRSSASDAWPTTSKPASSSSRARPARSRTESSAITTRMRVACQPGGRRRSGAADQASRRSSAAPQTSCLATKPRAPLRGRAAGIQRVVGARRDDHGAGRRRCRERAGDREAVHVGQAHVEQDDVGLQRQRGARARARRRPPRRRRRSRRPRAARAPPSETRRGRRRSGRSGTHCDSRHTTRGPQYGWPYPRGGQPNPTAPRRRAGRRYSCAGPGEGADDHVLRRSLRTQITTKVVALSAAAAAAARRRRSSC